MLVTDSDLVLKLRSLPFEEREALLRIVAVAQDDRDDESAGSDRERSRINAETRNPKA